MTDVPAKRIALVGHCGPDSSYLRMAVTSAVKGAKILMIDDDGDLKKSIEEGVDLLLLNRQLDYGFSTNEGVDLIDRLHKERGDLKLMLVSNYPDAQAAAVRAGALPGFGKREIGTPRVVQLIREALQ